ncbi:MAG: hypothetical protein JW810_03615 [Sedimentisphaerales bacterium]|nr:hypothetical protein [Sedimentisphaerales bacterium]
MFRLRRPTWDQGRRLGLLILSVLPWLGPACQPSNGRSAYLGVDPRTTQILSIRLHGTAGETVSGTLYVDGETRPVSGTLPLEFQIEACDLVCCFKKQTEPSMLVLEIWHLDSYLGGTTTWGEICGVRAEINPRHSLFTNFP